MRLAVKLEHKLARAPKTAFGVELESIDYRRSFAQVVGPENLN